MQNGGLSHTRGPALLKPRTQTQHQNIFFKIFFILEKLSKMTRFHKSLYLNLTLLIQI